MTVELKQLPEPRFADWQAAVRQRMISRDLLSGRRVEADAAAFADLLLSEMLATPSSVVLRIIEGEQELGTIWLAVAGTKLFLLDLDAALTAAQRDGLVAALLEHARQAGATRITAGVHPHDSETRALLDGRGFTVASIQMLLEPLPERAVVPTVSVVPMTDERYARFAEESVVVFAQDLIDSGRYNAEEALAESRRQFDEELPDGLDTPDQELFTAHVGGREVGYLWVGMRKRGEHPHAFVLDIEVAESERRKGYGRALMLVAEREARRLGAASVGLHVFGFNDAAIALYEQLGYRRTEETHLLDL